MPRSPRSSQQSGWFHVTNRGADRQPVFRSVADRVDFGNLLAAGHDAFGVTVLAYCLMDNHYHLVVSCPDGGLSDFMQLLGGRFTRHSNERAGGDGPIFRGRYFSRVVRSERYLANAVRYVHRNPLAIVPPVALDTYRWSSHRTYLGLRGCPDWLGCSPVRDWFGSVTSFREFVETNRESDGLITASGQAVWDAVEQIVDESAFELDRAPQGLARTACYLVLGQLAESRAGRIVGDRRVGVASLGGTSGTAIAPRRSVAPDARRDRDTNLRPARRRSSCV